VSQSNSDRSYKSALLRHEPTFSVTVRDVPYVQQERTHITSVAETRLNFLFWVALRQFISSYVILVYNSKMIVDLERCGNPCRIYGTEFSTFMEEATVNLRWPDDCVRKGRPAK